MNCCKIFFLLIFICFWGELAFGQANHVDITVTPSQVPDTLTKPAVVEVEPQQKSIASQEQVIYENKTLAPSSTLSIGTASAVTTTTATERKNQVPAAREKTTVNYSEQKVEKNDVPANNPVVTPK
jgi:hypothetical protein